MANTPNPRRSKRYPLLVYRTLGRRWRPASLILIIAGALLQLPRFAPSVFPETASMYPASLGPFDAVQLSQLGLLMLLVGLALYVGAVWRERRAYVQTRPDFLLISTAGNKTALSYMRINAIKSVLVRDMFPRELVTGGQYRFIRPHVGKNAVLLELDDYPLPEEQIRRRWSQFLLSTQQKGVVLLVKDYNELINEIDRLAASVQEAAMNDGRPQGYLDPIDRLRFPIR